MLRTLTQAGCLLVVGAFVAVVTHALAPGYEWPAMAGAFFGAALFD